MSLSDLFIDTGATCPAGGEPLIPDNGFGLFQLIFITLVYGYILASSSKMIADGSELLLLVMNPGVVGEHVKSHPASRQPPCPPPPALARPLRPPTAVRTNVPST